MTKRKPFPKSAGVPSIYSQEKADYICEQMSAGRSLRKVCEDEGMVTMLTVMNWLSKHPEFVVQYTKAQETRADTLLDQLQDLADTPAIEFATPGDPSGVKHRQLQISTRQWAISKLYPKKYGDRVQTEHSGKVEVTNITRQIVDPKK